jgi:hypothetical protein
VTMVIGLVVGVGAATLVWTLGSGPSSGSPAADAAAVCAIVDGTPDVPANPEDITNEYMQRWSVSEVAASVAKADDKYKPLADALNDVAKSIRYLDLKKMRTAIQQARTACTQV